VHYHLVPFLSSSDIINLNETLPINYRIIQKFKKQWIHDHHEKVLIEKLTSLMSRADLNKGQEKYYHILYKLVKELKALSKDHKIIIATDNDREGEGIGEGLIQVLKLQDYDRIVFTEITNKAITTALKKPSKININLAHAQEARRILDRLMGYLISPVMWKYLEKDAKSAGRVQSVVNRIIIDKETEIKDAISTPFIKVIGTFNGLQSKLDETKHLDSMDKTKEFLSLISKKTEFKIANIENKKSIRKASAPFITSTLQQDASTKLRFNPKKTMEVAQKLYEAGLITYMRTDSPNISTEISEECKDHIIKEYGEEYSMPKNYSSSSKTSQEAHECIRPTHIDNDVSNLSNDQMKLYTLIWKRTVASQMSNAKINCNTISIDAINKKSILVFDKQCYFRAVNETIEFKGFLILYNDKETDSDTKEDKDDKEPQDMKIGDLLKMDKIKATEEYTSLPLHYNEAGLIKYLEKNGIGRPSTFASIITKVIERNYIEIKDIVGTAKDSKQLELSKSFKLKEDTKQITIGSEKQKLVPTSIGYQINDFLMKHFDSIINIDFTAQMENQLDLIAEGKANYITVIRNFYDMFNPTIEKLVKEAKSIKSATGSSTDILLGSLDNKEYYKGSGKFGPYVKTLVGDKWKYASVKDIEGDITLDTAVELFEYPKELGNIGNSIVTLNKGQYGIYIKHDNKNIAIKNDVEEKDINLEFVKKLIENNSNKSFTVKNKTINIRSGEYGPYLQIVSSNKKQNISIPKKYNISTITIHDILQIIADKNSYVKK
jgi:DNA topoisomerase-1